MEIFQSEIFLGLVNGRENVQIHRPGVRFKEAFKSFMTAHTLGTSLLKAEIHATCTPKNKTKQNIKKTNVASLVSL